MRILRLDLLAFGPFTDLSLDFSQGDHGLHLVYGLNEAGKSSSLRAIRQLLFGIPPQTGDNFLHSYPNLRIGAQLLGDDDRAIEVIRRKARDKTLRGSDDIEVISPTIIQQMLGHIDEDTFRSQFGIDHQQLTAGGRQIAAGQGEAGSILFAAASGITNLNKILDQLNADAKVLFMPTGKNPKINQSIAALKEAKKKIKETSLLSEDWTRHHEALQKAKQRKQEIENTSAELSAESSHLERIAQALPIVPPYVELQDEANRLATAPQLAANFGESRRVAMADHMLASTRHEEAQQAIKRLQAAIDRLDRSESILENADAIEQIVMELGGIRKAQADVPGLLGQHRQLERKILEAMSQLGGEAEATRLQIGPGVEARIGELATERQSLVAQQETAIARLRQIETHISQVGQTLAKLPSDSPDTGPLQRTIRDIEQQGPLEQQLSEANLRLEQLQQQADIDLQRLPHWSGRLDQLEKLATPTAESIDRYDDELKECHAAVDQIARELELIEAELREKSSQLDRLQREQEIPSEQDLRNSRAHRERGWRLVRNQLNDASSDEQEQQAFVDRFPSAADLTEAFEQSIEQADTIADRLRREAEAVSQKAALTADQARLSERTEDYRQHLAEVKATENAKRQQWEVIWTAIEVSPQSPREMREWAARQQQLAATSQEIRQQRAAVSQLQAAIENYKTQLSAAISPAGGALLSVEESLAVQLEASRELVERLSQTDAQRQLALRDQKRLQDEQTGAQQTADDSRHAIDQWNANWSESIAPLGLASDASVAQANAILKAVANISDMTRESTELSGRIEGINADGQRFQTKVADVCSQIAMDLVDVARESAEKAVLECRRRLTAAREAKTQLDELRQQQAEQRERLNAAATRRSEAEAKLKALCHEAGCRSADELQQIEEQAARRSTVSKELHDLTERLLNLSAGKPVDKFIVEIQAVDADALPAVMEQLHQQLDKLNEERSQVDATIGSEETHLKKMDSSAEATRASEEAEHHRASIAADAEGYARLRLSSVVLRGAIERYRERHQGPLLRRASELFSELTLGRFDELRADYDSKGNATLLGVRQGTAATVGTDQMSDGTCDQLYLALRLASLEHHFQSNPAVPFIVDDVLIRFDDDRAVAALKALGQLSGETQVIFFTHHEHLVKLAEENLDNDVLFTHTLDSDERSTQETSALTPLRIRVPD